MENSPGLGELTVLQARVNLRYLEESLSAHPELALRYGNSCYDQLKSWCRQRGRLSGNWVRSQRELEATLDVRLSVVPNQ